MRLLKVKNKVFIEVDEDGCYHLFLMPPFEDMVKNSTTPVLEDFFATINMELQERDREEVEKWDRTMEKWD